MEGRNGQKSGPAISPWVGASLVLFLLALSNFLFYQSSRPKALCWGWAGKGVKGLVITSIVGRSVDCGR
jgi:hypothetical protein